MHTARFKLFTLIVVLTFFIPQLGRATLAQSVAAAGSLGSATQLLTNGSFDTPGSLAPWALQVSAPAQASMTQTTSAAVNGPDSAAITVSQAPSGTSPWNVALIQDQLGLVAGATYNLTFWAKSSTARSIDAGVQQEFAPYQWRFFQTFNLTTAWQSYSVTFVAPTTESPVKLQFDLGQAASTVWIDGVSLASGSVATSASPTATAAPPVATPAPVLPTTTAVLPTATPAPVLPTTTAVPPTTTSASLLANGSFDTPGSLAPWALQVSAPAQASMTQTTSAAVNGPDSAAITVSQAPSGTSPWNVTLIQDQLSLVAGATYNLTFWAKSSTARSIDAGVQQEFAPYQWRFFQSFNLTTAWQSYSASFVAPATESPVKLQFDLAQATGTVWLDGVSFSDPAPASGSNPVVVNTATAVPAAPTAVPPTATPAPVLPTATAVPPTTASASLLTNGSFDTPGSLAPWALQVSAPAQASMTQDASTAVNGPDSAAITVSQAPSGTSPWNVTLIQDHFGLVAGATYNLTFWAKSSTARSIDAGVQQEFAPYQWRFFQTFNLTTTWQSYSASFVAPATESPVKLQFDLAQATGTVWLDGVSFSDPAPASGSNPVVVNTATAVPAAPTAVPPTATPAPVLPTATPVPSATSQTGSADPSGQPMPVGDLPGWHQIFTDDFTTNAPLGSFRSVYGSKWGDYGDGVSDTTGHGQYWISKVVSVSNGMMNMYIHTENGVHMVAAPIPLATGAAQHGQLYGRYTVRWRSDSLPGYKTAWLLWPQSQNWPHDGELDYPEGDLDSVIGGAFHYQGGTSGNSQTWFKTAINESSGWHTSTIEWTPSSITYYLDGAVVAQLTNASEIPNTPMWWVLQTETSTDGETPNNTTAGNVQVDWVAAYSYNP